MHGRRTAPVGEGIGELGGGQRRGREKMRPHVVEVEEMESETSGGGFGPRADGGGRGLID